MKTLKNNTIHKHPETIFIKDETLIRFKDKELFAEKNALAKEKLKNIQLPPR